MHADGALAATLVNDGATELVVWKTSSTVEQPSSTLEVYRLSSDQPPLQIGHTQILGSGGPEMDPIVLTGDIDVSSAGQEVVIVGGDRLGRSARVCVFGREGGLHLLSDFHMPRRAVGSDPSVPTIGDVVEDARHPGSELVIGGQRGRVYMVGLNRGRAKLLSVLRALRDRPHASARRLAVGDIIPNNPGDEIVVGDDGTVGDGLVRIFDSRTRRAVAEFQAFSGLASSGVELWVGDVMSVFPGAELIVGEGSAGGRLSVFTLASGVPTHVLDIPDPLGRSTSLHGHLAIGNLLPEFPGNEIALAQSDSQIPVQVFNLDADPDHPTAAVQAPPDMQAVTAIDTTY
jgi:hypothetical protein